ncbi:MAG: DUF2157 domain-containing protein, partial [Deltaproteobacteria bacterium]|nr:DUF2157 domain-containing protein [Deltaproteobacteria bacterium]
MELGWLSETDREAILADLDSPQERYRPFALALAAGLVLVVLGIIALVSGNWNGVGYGLRLLILLGGMTALYAGALAAVLRGSPRWISESLFVLAASLFGANIVLIAQMYHISSDSIAGAVMLWCAGGLVTVWGARSAATLNLVFLTLLLWTCIRLTEFSRLEPWLDFGVLLFPVLWGSAVVTAARWQWRPVPHYGLITLLFFLYYLSWYIGEEAQTEGAAFFTATCLFIFVAARATGTVSSAILTPWLAGHVPVVERYALGAAALTFASLYFLISEGRHAAELAYGAGFTVLAAVAAATSLAFLQRSTARLPLRDAAAVTALLLGTVLQPYLSGIDEASLFFWSHAGFALILALWLIDFGLRGDPFWRF